MIVGVLMKEKAWWQEAVIYQVYRRSFQDSNGDGVGDLNGISLRLEHLVDLGIDAIWISPIFPSPVRDFGYDVSDYCAIHPLFGSLADFDALLESAHAHGVNVILDFVPNHTSDERCVRVSHRAAASRLDTRPRPLVTCRRATARAELLC
jgi:alpha-glucosidase